MKRYGPHPHWFAQRHISQIRAMRRVVLKGGLPNYRKFSSKFILQVWKEKRQQAMTAKYRRLIKSLPYREQTRRMARHLTKLRVFW
jgi:hypothetical protein